MRLSDLFFRIARLPLEKTKVCIGVPIHNSVRFLKLSLESLAQQTFGDFRVIALNDGSTDGSGAIARAAAARDRRVLCVDLPKRSGLVKAWRTAAEIAAARFNPEYFGWHGDHDLLAPDWLETLVKNMESSPGTVLAHARTLGIDTEGREVAATDAGFDTTGLPLWARLEKATLGSLGAGDAVYGLFRCSVLRKCSVFRDEIYPDKLLVSEANLHGSVRYVKDAVRYRRQTYVAVKESAQVDRQLQTLFRDGFTKKNPFLSHATCLLNGLVSNGRFNGSSQERYARIYHAVLYYYRHIEKFHNQILQETSAESPEAHAGFFRDLAKANIKQKALLTWTTCRVFHEKRPDVFAPPAETEPSASPNQ